MNEIKIKIKKNTKKLEKFRLNAKRLFLTYPQINENIEKEKIIELLRSAVHIKDYLVGKENHKDGGIHYHILLILWSKCNIRDSHKLDLEINGKLYHGKYETIRNLQLSINYIIKRGDFIKSDNLKVYVDKFNNRICLAKHVLEIAREKGCDAALDKFIQENPESTLRSIKTIESSIKFILKREEAKKTKIEPQSLLPELDQMQNIPKAALSWYKRGRRTSAVFTGPSGCGKTLLAQLMTKDHKTLLVKSLEALRKLTPEYTGLILDDIKLSQMDIPSLLGLLDRDLRGEVRILYSSVDLKNIEVLVITINKLSDVFNDPRLIQILRRAAVVNFKERMVPHPNIVNNFLFQFNLHSKNHCDEEILAESLQEVEEHEQQLSSHKLPVFPVITE